MDDMNRRYSARATNPPILAVPHTNTPSGHSAWGVMFPVILALKLVCAEAALVIPTEPPTAAIVSKGNTAKNFVDDFIRTSPRGRGATIRSLVGRIAGLDTTQHGKTNSTRFESLGRRLVSTQFELFPMTTAGAASCQSANHPIPDIQCAKEYPGGSGGWPDPRSPLSATGADDPAQSFQ